MFIYYEMVRKTKLNKCFLLQVLDATFDSITPLAVERMPEIMCKKLSAFFNVLIQPLLACKK